MRLILLTIFQAIIVNAAPLKPRQACDLTSTVTNVITVTIPAEAETLATPVTGIDEARTDTGEEIPNTALAKISTSAVTAIVLVSTATTPDGTAQVLPTPSAGISGTLGTIITTLAPVGGATLGPLLSTSIAGPTSLITAFESVSSVASQFANDAMPSADIFQPVATGPPPSSIGTRSDHPVPRLGIQSQNASLSTNKFYANFFLGSQTAPTWTHPYALSWAKGSGPSQSWGIAVSHIDPYQRVFGPDPAANPASYFINPNGIQSLILSAAELGGSTVLTTDCLTAFSVNVNLVPSDGAVPAITFPLVQGMGFVTAIYHGSTPFLQTGVFFRTITRCSTSPKAGVTKYSILLEDGKTWFLYGYSRSGATLDLKVVSNSLAQSTSNWDGIIQIAKNAGGPAEALYDTTCAAYAISSTLSGSVNGATGTYTLSFAKGGLYSSKLLMFALPHHLQSFHPATNASTSQVQLQTTTKGLATAVVADSWTLVEPKLPVDMNFAPWSPTNRSQSTLSPSAVAAIQSVAASEISQDMSQQSNLDSFYFAGKALGKFAGIVYTVNNLLKNPSLAHAGLARLKTAFERFSTNRNQFPLVYETAWGGVVSSGSYTTGDPNVDFGNTYYNDHHFHFGYFIYTAAIIGYLDPSWLAANKDFVNTLVRDIANPSPMDPYFPPHRAFDWYHGHSWAHGLYESYDGKDEESTSEDSMSAYALKMWGRTIGDANLEARGNLQLAITARSIQSYFLYEDGNTIQPAQFIGNKVSGILFENKIDHTTYFGTNIEYIQGIHMIPLLPSSTLTRTRQFVAEEWDKYFSGGRVDGIVGGWRGILYANLAIVDPVASWMFFTRTDFDPGWLDGGASRTWYLALSAALGGCL